MALDTVLGKMAEFEDWATRNVAGQEWADTGKQEALPWKELPLSSVWAPVVGMTLYLAAIPLVTRLMKDRDPISFPRLLLSHNLFLTLASAWMCGGVIWTCIRNYRKYGWTSLWDDPEWIGPTTEMQYWCYLFYISKYYELLDSLFILLKKRKLAPVQIWHHASVMALFWAFMNARMMNHHWLALANTFVHVFVYGYFCLATLKVEVPWKRYITLMQIAQFIFDMSFCAPWPYFKLKGWTRGDWGPVMLGYFIGATFVVLFTQIYFRIKRERREREAKKKEAAAKAEAEKPKVE